ncbi:MAG: c-type cytochrome [Candidatus Binatia bacterium]
MRRLGITLLPCFAAALVLLPDRVRAGQPAPATSGWFEIEAPATRPAPSRETIAEGKRIYDFRCSPCHGIEGNGEGPVAPFLDPRPRDFTLANFKFRTTAFGELPRDEDLFRTITRGIPGTAMPSWAPLPAEERWKVIYYIKTFSDFFGDPDFDPHRVEDGKRFTVEVPRPPAATPERIAYGRKVFLRAKCTKCHGMEGRGDGPSAGTQFTARKHRILPRDLTKGWRYKGGTHVEDIWRTLTTGLNGTPMPSFIGSLDQSDPEKDEADRWAVAQYVRSLVVEVEDEPETVLRVRRVKGTLPTDPDDAAWEGAHEIHFRMLGQVTRRPRWQTPAVDFMRIRALHDGTRLALRLEYDDRTQSTERDGPDIVREETTYPKLDVTRYVHTLRKYPDAVAVQFPARHSGGVTRPYFLYGQSEWPVVLWRFEAGPTSSFREFLAKGAEKIRPTNRKRIQGRAAYANGQWRVVMTRPLAATDPRTDVSLTPGRYIPFLAMAWDGGNGESGLRQSLSSWYTLQLAAPIPRQVYARSFGAFLLAGVFEWVLVRRARRQQSSTSGGKP